MREPERNNHEARRLHGLPARPLPGGGAQDPAGAGVDQRRDQRGRVHSRAAPADLKGGDADHNAAAIRFVLSGRRDSFRDIVVLNSAAALMVAGVARDLKDGAAMATASIDGGKALKSLETLVRICA